MNDSLKDKAPVERQYWFGSENSEELARVTIGVLTTVISAICAGVGAYQLAVYEFGWVGEDGGIAVFIGAFLLVGALAWDGAGAMVKIQKWGSFFDRDR